MDYKIEGFKYKEAHNIWNGSVKCKGSMFKDGEISLNIIIENKNFIEEAEYNTVLFLKDNFHILYNKILKILFDSNFNEFWSNSEEKFKKIKFNEYFELHKYIGIPVIFICQNKKKKGFSFYCVNFLENCYLSIERGISAVCYKNDLVHWGAYECESLIADIMYYEKDSNLWNKDFWKFRYQPKYWFNNEDNDNELKKKWLNI